MRNHLLFSVNGARQRVEGDDARLPLSTFLRERLRLTGTKVVCAEGDCGACSVLVARESSAGASGGPLDWQPIDACITFLHQVDGCHLMTVEGVPFGDGEADGEPGAERSASRDPYLHPVQTAMIERFGSQCGFCTPGFVVTLAAMAERARQRGAERLEPAATRRGLTGNLCRCTGYLQILEAAEAVPVACCPPLDAVLDRRLRAELALAAGEEVRIEAPGSHDGAPGDSEPAGDWVYLPTSLEAASAALAADPRARPIAGATDLGVQHNKGRLEPGPLVQLGPRIPGFDRVEIAGGRLRAAAGATWTSLLEAVRDEVPQLAEILERFGAPQIRNLGTIGGNLANASPIADSLPFLYVMGAELELVGPGGRRRLPIEAFYRGYKEIDLGRGELIAAIEVPLPEPGEVLRLRKLSRRFDLDISSVTAAFHLSFAGDRIDRARIAFGGVGPTVLRAPRAEVALAGHVLDLELARRAGRIARAEVTPITDVRGSEEYRARLVERLFVELAYELTASPRIAASV
ncbi:MAG TPA: FAD binding domain-containing protein [Thermoanaerobaculia bacterium]|nr:FAD binding domain-containing protein [Thermoanaerobaculia bacterium]